MINVIGLDVGGANIKVTDLNQKAKSVSFPLWKQKEALGETVRALLEEYPHYEQIALTMTGELADCFPSKAEGVRYITQEVVTASESTPVVVWQTAGEFVPPHIAIEYPLLTAASNWHALATWAARATSDSSGLLIDIGSTTADIIPLHQGSVASTGLTDFERLRSGELVYTGGRRTPLSALARSIMIEGKEVPLAAEYFATTQDLYQVLELIPEEPTSRDTADGRPADIPHASHRIARMLCCDLHELGIQSVRQIAEQLAQCQLASLKRAARQVLGKIDFEPKYIVASGSSEFLVNRLIESLPELSQTELISMTDSVSPEIASAACAHAVAFLAYERCR